MHPAPLPRRPGEDLADGFGQPGVGVGDDETHPGQPAGAQAAQELGPKHLVLRIADREAQHLPLAGGGHPVATTTARATI